MTNSVVAFNLSIDRFMQEEVPEAVGQLSRLIATDALRKLVLKSPVLTGRFRGSWTVTVATRTTEALPELPREARRGGELGQAAIDAGVGVIAGAKPFQSIIIQNNVEYAEDLETGTSRQAPNGVLMVTVAELEVEHT